jgi:ribokinase
MEIVRRLVSESNYYLPSRQELLGLWQGDSVEGCLHVLNAELPGTIVVVKDGKRGAVTIQERKVVRVPAFEVIPIHEIGAGDSFNAGFVAKTADGGTVVESVRFGCAAAALNIARPFPPTRDAVLELLSG